MENEMNPGNHQLSITVYHSGQYGNAQNCTYPYSSTGSTPDELKKLFCYDHTFIWFKNNYRSKVDMSATAALAVLALCQQGKFRIKGKIALTPAVELSYLTETEQAYLLETMESEDCTPSLSQAQQLKALSQRGELTMDGILPNPAAGKPPVVIYPDECWFCGLCVEACKFNAIALHYPINQRLFFKRKTIGEIFRIDGGDAPAQSYFEPPVG